MGRERVLQRGRDAYVADRLRYEPLGFTRRRFNGAATRTSRIARGERAPNRARTRASTGPRRVRRG